MEQLSIAEAHGPRLPDLDALGDELELVLIVWEAAQGTPLPAYVARYTSQIPGRSDDPSSPRKAERGSAAASAVAGGEESSSRGLRARRSKENLCAASSDVAAACLAAAATHSGESATGSAVGAGASGGGATTRGGGRSSSPAKEKTAETSAPSASSGSTKRPPRVLVVCNKCDVMPCPMPQIRGLEKHQAFIAVSAERGTNLPHLWQMVSPVLARGAKDRAQSPAKRKVSEETTAPPAA